MKPGCDGPGVDGIIIAELIARRFDAAVIFTVYSQNPLAGGVSLLSRRACRCALAYCREKSLSPAHPLATRGGAGKAGAPRSPAPARSRRCDRLQHGRKRAPFRSGFPLQASLKVEALGLRKPFVAVPPGREAPLRGAIPAEHFRASHGPAGRCDRMRGRVSPATRASAPLVEIGSPGDARAPNALARRPPLPAGARCDRAGGGTSSFANNTGPVHLAAALGTPVVDLYALTNPQHTPWQVEKPRAFPTTFPCRNCYKSVCPQGHHDCLPPRRAGARRRRGGGAASARRWRRSHDHAGPQRRLPRFGRLPGGERARGRRCRRGALHADQARQAAAAFHGVGSCRSTPVDYCLGRGGHRPRRGRTMWPIPTIRERAPWQRRRQREDLAPAAPEAWSR